MSHHIVAVDLGASSGRVYLASFSQSSIRLEEVYRFPNDPVSMNGDLYWNIYGLYQGIKTGLEKVVGCCEPAEISSLGINSWGVDFALLDGSGRLLDGVHHYRDPRTRDVVGYVKNHFNPLQLYRLTGAQFARFNTLCQLISLRKERPWILETAERLLMIGELFSFFLTGEKVSEWTNATTSQLFELERGTWSKEVMESFQLPLNVMPPVKQAGTELGPLQKVWAKQMGLQQLLVRLPAVHDTACAVAAAPLPNMEPAAFISSGTWSLIGTIVDQPITTFEAMTLNFANEGAADGKILLLKNVQGMWLLQQCMKYWNKGDDPLSWDLLLKEADQASSLQAAIDPDYHLFFEEDKMPEKIVTYLKERGQWLPGGRGEMVRMILESLVLKYRWVIESLEKLSQLKFKAINIVGGGSQNNLLNQMVADATGCPVVAGPVEATIIGNVLSQAVGMGLLGDYSEGRELINNSFQLKHFQPCKTDGRWDDAYGRFQEEILKE